jgi:hypothetical protein
VRARVSVDLVQFPLKLRADDEPLLFAKRALRSLRESPVMFPNLSQRISLPRVIFNRYPFVDGHFDCY